MQKASKLRVLAASVAALATGLAGLGITSTAGAAPQQSLGITTQRSTVRDAAALSRGFERASLAEVDLAALTARQRSLDEQARQIRERAVRVTATQRAEAVKRVAAQAKAAADAGKKAAADAPKKAAADAPKKAAADAPKKAAADAPKEAAAVGHSPTTKDPRSIARAMMSSQYGWGAAQYQCFNTIIMAESGWKVDADNPTSSAYGIPQALPGRRMASAGADWETNPATQIRWGLGYIKDRYGTPCQALSFRNGHDWY